ncbi:nitrile hydratase subunit beta [Pseudomonadota bacterium]
MDGIHDMGGMHGFGAIDTDEDGQAFHAEWEGRVFALNIALMAATGQSLDAGRAGIERLPPAEYLSLLYFGRWFNALCRSLAASGVFTAEQMQDIQQGKIPNLRIMTPVAGAAGQTPSRGVDLVMQGRSPQREIARQPALEIGDRVRGRNMHPRTHTRMPRYVRGHLGMVIAWRGAHVFPDSNALGLGQDPGHLYSVRFSAAELWGEAAHPLDSVTVDLWESYLEPA